MGPILTSPEPTWDNELVMTDRVKTLTAGDIRSRCAAVHQLVGRPALKHLKHLTCRLCVSESCPTCHVTPRDPNRSDPVRIDCSVTASGNWNPSLQISGTGPPTVLAALTLVNKHADEDHLNITRTLDYHVSVTMFPMSSRDIYTSEIVFREDGRSAVVSATNIPAVNCTWKSSYVHTSCKLRSLLLSTHAFIAITSS